MSNKLIAFTVENSEPELLLPQLYVHPTYLFLMQLKSYFEHSLGECFDNEPRNKILLSSVNCVVLLTKICNRLDVRLEKHTAKLFAYKIHSLHGFIQGVLFENCFEAAVKYFGVRYLILSKEFKDATYFIKDQEE